MFPSNPDVPEKSLHIKQDEKFLSKLLAREANNPSFRVYNGGVVGSVPFMWESRPGTPKNKHSENSLPPLTPPPSYLYFNSNKKPIKKNSRSSLLYSLFPRINLRNRKLNVFTTRTNPLASSSLSSNSSSSFALSNSRCCDERSSVSSFHSVADCEEEVQSGSPRSVLCFGINRGFVYRFGGCKKW